MGKSVCLIVLNNFTNDSRVLKESLSLQKYGYRVKVVALYEKPLKEFELIQNVEIYRIKLKTRNWPKYKIIQLIKYLEFAFKFIKKFRKEDILHCNDLETLPIGVLVKVFFNQKVRLVYDAHEYEIYQIPGQSEFIIKIKYLLEKFLLRYVDSVITLNILQKKLNYKPYPYKHYESVFTRFYQGYILPRKFNVDKRKLHLSTLIISGQMTREEALADLQKIPYPSDKDLKEDIEYFLKKMRWAKEQLEEYLSRPEKPHTIYGSERWLWEGLRKVYGVVRK